MNTFNENDTKYNKNTYLKSNSKKLNELQANVNKFGRLVVARMETINSEHISKRWRDNTKKQLIKDVETFYNENKTLAQSDIYGYGLSHRRTIYTDLRVIERLIRFTCKVNEINTLSDVVRRNRW